MSYFTISNWEAEEWSAEMEAIARDQFAPLVMSCGASCVDFIKTGELTFSVVTRYTDEATATAAAVRTWRQAPASKASAARGCVLVAGLPDC